MAQGQSYETVLRHLDVRGIHLFDMATLRRWFRRLVLQVHKILPALTALAQREAPELSLSRLRAGVRDAWVMAYYERLTVWAGPSADSGNWNLLRLILYVFAPSLSGNRVSYGLLPTPPP
ncbi:hypothetical protein GCM10010885_24540 [Alicyclobacillus cellulosilyticus]|uniref:Uncharacterized protein n=1 Tax=Alicyclobacillus cellulosilyticus TaxID=1003997 RepID=A0A917KHI1_9BACL|nr:hypothetical protein [Alicyclobacillus cellulosilyticus]GGJ14353.1 hypothetical protein GCM10010885_24540 [Alicyclobacillus cellulosilyticus]